MGGYLRRVGKCAAHLRTRPRAPGTNDQRTAQGKNRARRNCHLSRGKRGVSAWRESTWGEEISLEYGKSLLPPLTPPSSKALRRAGRPSPRSGRRGGNARAASRYKP